MLGYNKLIYKDESIWRADDEALTAPSYSFYLPKKLKAIRTTNSNMLLELYDEQYISIKIKCREDCLTEDLFKMKLSSEDVEDLFELENFAYKKSLFQTKNRVSLTLDNKFVTINLLNIKTNLVDKLIEFAKSFIFLKEGSRSKRI